MIKISIVVPVYNVEKYLIKCIDSLLSQSYKNYEIILVDDGSTDNSAVICDEYSEKYSCITVVHKKNEGLGFARNTGIELANGEYITFVDSDDYVDKNLLFELYESIESTGADTCLGGFKRVNNNGKVIFKNVYEKEIYYGSDIYSKLLPKMIGSAPERSDSIRMSVWNAMYSMKIIKENYVRFPSEREYISEDIMFDIEYYKYSSIVSIIDNCLYNYRLNEASLTMKYKESRFNMAKKLYYAIKEKIIQSDIKNQALYRLQRQFFIHIRECIKQENINVSGYNEGQALNNIGVICNDDLVQDIISNYPINRLQFKQKIFIYLIKYRMKGILYFGASKNVF